MKIAVLHRYPEDQIKSTNASFPYFLEELRGRGDSVDVITYKRFNRMKPFWKSLWWVVYAPLRVAYNLKEYDLIYCDDSFPYYAGLVKLVSNAKVYKRMGDLHLMYHTHGWVYKFLHWLERWEWRSIDWLVTVSDAMADYMFSQFVWRVPTEQQKPGIVTVLDPIDLGDFFYPSTERWDVMFHGTLTKNKNVDVLLEAAKRLPQYNFCVVGDGPELKRLVEIAPKNVGFTGWVGFSEIPAMLAKTKIGIAMRSDNPGNEYVYTQPYLQYAACGKVVLATRRKVLAGYPYTFDDVDTLVEWIEEILQDDEEYEFHRKRSQDWIRIEQHDAKRIAKQLAYICCNTNA